VRYPVSGEVCPRNNYRGDRYFSIDSGLHKNRQITEGQQLFFAWGSV